MDHDLQPARKIPVDRAIAEASADDYDGLILPGGVANPDNLRQDEKVGFCAKLVEEFAEGEHELSTEGATAAI